MATPMTRAQMEALTNLEPALRAVFFDQIAAIADKGTNDLMSLYQILESEDAVERSQGVGGFGDFTPFNGSIDYDAMEMLFQTTYNHEEYVKGFAAERKLIDDERYGVLSERATRLGIAANRTIYKHAASVFNNAFATGVAGGDGKPLVSATHPKKPGSSATYDNHDTAVLAQSAVVAAEEAMMAFKDANGDPVSVMPDTLVVPVALKNEALTIAGSNQLPGSPNNDINTMEGYRVIVSRYLTSSTAWFLVDSALARTMLKWYWRIRPEFAADPSGDFSLVPKYRGYMRYSFGWDDWRWVYGSTGAG
jgi:phage major head subunit gpT-like protein